MIKETATWKILNYFPKPIRGENIQFKEIPLTIPPEIEKTAVERWNSKLEKESKKYEKVKIAPYVTSPSGKTMNALLIDGKLQYYPGQQISLEGVNKIEDNLEINVSQIHYPYVIVLQEGEFAELNSRQLHPIMPFHLCTIAITKDYQIALTLRSPQTMSFPNTLWGEGGNPETPTTNIIEHQQREMLEEILVKPEEASDFKFMGIASIKLPYKNTNLDILPGLIGYVHVNLSSKEIRERVLERPMSQRPNDVIDVVFCPSDKKGLFDYLTNKTSILQYCPTGHTGLVLYGSEIGIKWNDNSFR
jgi:hypothetical protein